MYTWEILTEYKDSNREYWRVSRAKENIVRPTNSPDFYETLWQGLIEHSNTGSDWKPIYQADMYTQFDEPLKVDQIVRDWLDGIAGVALGIVICAPK